MEYSNQGSRPPHFVLIPLMAPGHTIPMVDMARIFAARGVVVSLVATPLNAARIRPTFDHAVASGGLPLRLVEVPFPCQAAGLPDGCENLDTIPSRSLVMNFFTATAMLRGPVEELLRAMADPPPTCIVSDMGLPWTTDTARELGVPRVVFHGTCCFSLLCYTNMRLHNPLGPEDADADATFVVPELPHRIEMRRSQLPENFASGKAAQGLRDEILEKERAAVGVVVNSFEGLEPEYIEAYQKVTGKKAWTIGPVSLCSKAVHVDRGNRAAVNEEQCLRWLDSMEPKGSVIYVSFGTLTRQTPEQLIEIGLGLEASTHPFIWVIKGGDRASEFERWVEDEGFEERTKGRCLLIRGWAPQVVILSHPAVGGFLTHCGWNSCLEGVAAGVPMVTWPLFAEQFFNERLVVDVLRVGVAVGVRVATKWHEEEEIGVVAGREEVQRAVREVMGGGEEAEGRRRRATELGERASGAVEEGGTSYMNVGRMIEDIAQWTPAGTA